MNAPPPLVKPESDDNGLARRPTSLRDLFVTFTWLALQGFGGVMAVAQHGLVERKRWLSRQAFAEMLSLSQVLPGPNIVNLALMVGDRFMGWRGAGAALAGILTVPLVVVMTLAIVVQGFAQHPWATGALRGMGAVAAGLVLGMAIKLMSALKASPIGWNKAVVVAAVAALAVAWWRWPLAAVVLGMGAVSVALAYWQLKRTRAQGERGSP